MTIHIYLEMMKVFEVCIVDLQTLISLKNAILWNFYCSLSNLISGSEPLQISTHDCDEKDFSCDDFCPSCFLSYSLELCSFRF